MPEASRAKSARILSGGSHSPTGSVARSSRRARLLEAIVSTVAEKGYPETSVGDVSKRAGVSCKEFHEYFIDKETCFLAAYEQTVDQLVAEIKQAIEAISDPFAAAAVGVQTFLGFLAAHPAASKTFLIRILAAGPEALERRSRVHDRFVDEVAAVYDMGRRLFPELPPVPRHRLHACVGGVDALVTEHVRRHGPTIPPLLGAQVLDVALGLLVGDERATRLQAELQRRMADPRA